jgi:integrase/recombinase XerD
VSLGKQAKILTDRQISLVLASLDSRYPIRDRVMALLSITTGLRANEIASLTWSMVTAEGNVSDVIALTSKGKRGGSRGPDVQRPDRGGPRSQGIQAGTRCG